MTDFSAILEKLKDRPVVPEADKVIASTMAGKVTVIASPTGSGKSMVLPAHLSDAIYAAEPDASEKDKQVVVLVPRRNLATDAARNVSALAGTKLGEEVGYAVGKMAGDKSLYGPKTKVLFVTYGYAISSGLINTAKNIVLDEVHEAGEDASLARAILHERKNKGHALRLLEMSATINAQRQANYWEGVADTAVHTVEGSQLSCEVHEIDARDENNPSVEDVALDLLDQGRKGIAIFRPGIREIENTVYALQQKLKAAEIDDVEVVSIYGGSSPDERRKAQKPPEHGKRKIIVGTNVIESGVNMNWLDSGISDGVGKIPYDRLDTGASALQPEDLPQWRITQQMGRINRDPKATGFASGIFVLHSAKKWEKRALYQTPELERVSFNRIAFRAAALGYIPETLHLDAQIGKDRLPIAKRELTRLQLINDDWSLTKDGRYASTMPLSPEASAMLCEGKRLHDAHGKQTRGKNTSQFLSDAAILAALYDARGLRQNQRAPHMKGKEAENTSDLIDALKAFLTLSKTEAAKTVTAATDTVINELLKKSVLPEKETQDEERVKLAEEAREQLKIIDVQRDMLRRACERQNFSFTGFIDTARMVQEIRVRDERVPPMDVDAPYTEERYNAMKRVILNGSVNRLFENTETGVRDLSRDFGGAVSDTGRPFTNYALGAYATAKPSHPSFYAPLVAGRLEEIPSPYRGVGAPQIIELSQPTSIPLEVFIPWAADRTDKDTLLAGLTSSGKTGHEKEIEAYYWGKALLNLPLAKMKQETQPALVKLLEPAVFAQGRHTASLQDSASTHTGRRSGR